MCRKLSQFENTIRQRKETAIIIPAFNEEANIRGMLEKVKKIMTPSIELLVVDDGSVDSTKEILKKLNISYISMGFNSGYGAALQTGVKYAERNGFEYVVLMDADGQHNPQDISVLLDILKNDKADFVIGSRFSEENIYQEGISRKLGRAFFSFLIYCLSGAKIKDPTSGFQAFNRKTQKIYSSELFPIDYPDADVLLLFAYHNLRIKEVPVKMNTTSGKSMHSGIRSALYYIYKMLLSMLIVLSYKKEIKRKAQNGY